MRNSEHEHNEQPFSETMSKHRRASLLLNTAF